MEQKRNNWSQGAAIASSVAALLLAGCMDDGDGGETGGQESALTCLGGNECAGMSECASGPGMNACEGMNECKGMGWVYVESEAECTEKGGTIKPEA